MWALTHECHGQRPAEAGEEGEGCGVGGFQSLIQVQAPVIRGTQDATRGVRYLRKQRLKSKHQEGKTGLEAERKGRESARGVLQGGSHLKPLRLQVPLYAVHPRMRARRHELDLVPRHEDLQGGHLEEGA